MGSLKSFIKSVRSAKTSKDERNVIQKESAKIRSAFRNSSGASSKSRRENVAKLLYSFTLGERTHFGQVECLKSLASPHFTDKRLGYLGTMLLLDEDQEVSMLVTNSIDNDSSHPNQYVMSLASTTSANIASVSMARDSFQRVEKLITSTNPYIKKKAALCALRIIRRVPDYEDIFVEHAKMLSTEDNHGVSSCGASLATDMIDNNPESVEHFVPVSPKISSKLKQSSTNGFAPEFDVVGVPDPFLQCKSIRLLRAIGQDNEELSEQMSDLLAAIATNTDNSKNAGNAVLYETVLTIFGIDTGPPQTDSGLRVLGINILAKFLTTKNINTRYAALNTSSKVVETEPAAVQRHRRTILDCISDPDVSIRRRALDSSYVLINAQNVRLMIKELLVVLEHCDTEFKTQLVFQIASNAERFAPNVKWHIDTLLRMFIHAGNHVQENVMSAFILSVINAPELQLYATQQAYAALKNDISQQAVTVVALWLIGEYGDLLLKNGDFQISAEISENLANEKKSVLVTAKEVVDIVVDAMNSPYENEVIQEYGINALLKSSSRCREAREVESIRVAIEGKEKSVDGEIQQRAVEYATSLGEAGSSRKGILARMPAPEFGDDLEAQHAKAMSKALIRRRRRPAAVVKSGSKTKSSASTTSDLSDLGAGDAPVSAAAASDSSSDIFGSSSEQPAQVAKANQDILALFGSSSTSQAPATGTVATVGATTSKSALDDLSSSLSPPAGISSNVLDASKNEIPSDAVPAWNNGDSSSSYCAKNATAGQAQIVIYFSGKHAVTDSNMQVALPKSQQSASQGISQQESSSGGIATQKMKVTGSEGANVKLRIRLSYTKDGQSEQFQFDISGFPKNLL